jgi:hypothetical protein
VLPPLVARKGSCLRILEVGNVDGALALRYGGIVRNKLTLANLVAPALYARLEVVKGIKRRQDLHTADGVEHVGVVARGSAKAAALMQARKDEIQNVCAREGVRVAQQVQGGQPPVQAIQPQVLGEPVLELVFALRWSGHDAHAECAGVRRQTHRVEALDVADMLLHVQVHLGRHGAHGAAGPRDKGHVWRCGRGMGVRGQRTEVCIEC